MKLTFMEQPESWLEDSVGHYHEKKNYMHHSLYSSYLQLGEENTGVQDITL